MKARLFSTLILWSTILLVLYSTRTNGAVWLLAIVSALTQLELYGLWKKIGLTPLSRSGSIAGALCILTGHYLNTHGFDGGLAAFGISCVFLCLHLLSNPKAEYLTRTIMPTLAGMAIVPFAFYFLVSLVEFYARSGMERTGIFMGVWLIAVTKFADVGALLVGKMFGKHKLAPTISPGKTWEGVIGGLAISALVSYTLVTYFRDAFPATFTPQLSILIALPTAAAGIASDLLESVFKRMAKAKDSGSLIPGIGGIFDLTDSLLLASPVAYLLIKLTVF